MIALLSVAFSGCLVSYPGTKYEKQTPLWAYIASGAVTASGAAVAFVTLSPADKDEAGNPVPKEYLTNKTGDLAIGFSALGVGILGLAATLIYHIKVNQDAVPAPEVPPPQFGLEPMEYGTVQGNSYSDGHIDATFEIGLQDIGIVLFNKTDAGIKIDWTSAAFIDTDGTSEKVIHKGTRYIKRHEQQAPTTIPPQATLEDVMIPADNIHWESDGGWYLDELFPGFPNDSYSGKRFRVFLPMEVKGQLIEYTFQFRIDVFTVGPDGIER